MLDLTVLKKDGSNEAFSRDKVLEGVRKACWKRPVTEEQVGDLVDKVERELRKREGTEVASKFIGDLVLKRLRKLDGVAYIRFASVYRSFTDLDSFVKEVKALQD